jgi:hypothetical protein
MRFRERKEEVLSRSLIFKHDLEGESMNSGTVNPEIINQTVAFHGHWCPGLAIGIRAAEWALQEMGRATDEEIVAVVETDMCGVDAIQFLIGCTFGKRSPGGSWKPNFRTCLR